VNVACGMSGGVDSSVAGELIHRADDQPDTIRHRLEVYHRQTEPLITYYRETGLLINVLAEGDIEHDFALILKVLDLE